MLSHFFLAEKGQIRFLDSIVPLRKSMFPRNMSLFFSSETKFQEEEEELKLTA